MGSNFRSNDSDWLVTEIILINVYSVFCVFRQTTKCYRAVVRDFVSASCPDAVCL